VLFPRIAGDLSQARHYYQLAGNAFAAASSLTGQGFHQRGLGDLALAEGHPDRAESNFRHYLAHARATRSFSEELVALIGLGRALTRLDRSQESADILAEAIVKADNPAFIDFVLWPIVALAELKTAQGDYSQSALLAACVLHHPLAWLEMRDLTEDLLQTIEPHLGANFDRETAAQEAARTLIPEFNLAHLPKLES
jgi:tetratricopeptide (TPR) repeat protein